MFDRLALKMMVRFLRLYKKGNIVEAEEALYLLWLYDREAAAYINGRAR